MSAPTVAVTVNVARMIGASVDGAQITAKLDRDDRHNGFVVASSVTIATDSSGIAVLNLFPNALPTATPPGLGTTGSVYQFTIVSTGNKTVRVRAVIPNAACNLHDVVLPDEDADSVSGSPSSSGSPAPAPALGAVRYDIVQTLSDPQKLQARANVDFDASVRAAQVQGIPPFDNTPIANGVTMLTALSRLQGQINAGTGGGGDGPISHEYNPEQFGAIGDGLSHPLSTRYSTLEEAQAVYPMATDLTDEIDWCAWQKMVNTAYLVQYADWGVAVGQNLAGAAIWAFGKYVVNKTIALTLLRVTIRGKQAPVIDESGFSGWYGSWIKYNGPNGTVDDPVWILDAYARTELGGNPTDRLPQVRGVTLSINEFGFFGKGGDIHGDPTLSGFVSAVRIRTGVFSEITRCKFGATLWDGITCTAPQMFLRVAQCHFYGVMRDAIAVCAFLGDFSTTTWIRENEFGLVGRYAILLDFWGSVEPCPIIENNSFEHTFQSYFVQNPHWFVHGVVSGMCVIGGALMTFTGNRFEGVNLEHGYLSDVHLVSPGGGGLYEGNDFGKLTISMIRLVNPRSAAATAMLTTKGYYDITDVRYVPIGTHISANFGSVADGNKFDTMTALGEIQLLDGFGFGATMGNVFINTVPSFWSVPISGDFVDTAAARTLMLPPTGVSINTIESSASSFDSSDTRDNPIRRQKVWLRSPGLTVQQSDIDSQPEMRLFGEFWLRSLNPGTVLNGFKGWSLNRLAGDARYPSNYIDTAMFEANPADESGRPWPGVATHYESGVITTRKIRYAQFFDTPNSGTWNQGDIQYPAYGAIDNYHPVMWVCNQGGTPGRWSPIYPNGLDPDTLAWRNAIVANNVKLPENDVNAVDLFIKSAKTNGYWSQIQRFNPFIGNLPLSALLPVKATVGPTYDVAHNLGPFNQLNRTKGALFPDGSYYIDTGVIPGTDLTDGNTHFGVFAISGGNFGCGAIDSANGGSMLLYPLYAGGPISDAYSVASRITGPAQVVAPAFVMQQNDAANGRALYRDGNYLGGGAPGAVPITAVQRSIYIGAVNSDGTAAAGAGDAPVAIGAYCIGKALPDTTMFSLADDLRILMRGLGRL